MNLSWNGVVWYIFWFCNSYHHNVRITTKKMRLKRRFGLVLSDDDAMRTLLIPILTMLIHNTTTSWQFSIDYIIWHEGHKLHFSLDFLNHGSSKLYRETPKSHLNLNQKFLNKSIVLVHKLIQCHWYNFYYFELLETFTSNHILGIKFIITCISISR